MTRPAKQAIRFVLLAGGGLLLMTAAIGASLERWSAYRSPLAHGGSLPTPRVAALEALAEGARRRERETAERAEMLANLTQESMVALGAELVQGRGLCFNCHKVGRDGLGKQGPNLEGIGLIAAERVSGLSATEYLAQSLYRPDEFVVDGYESTMTAADEPPIGLDDDEIRMVVAYLETLGGTLTVTPETDLRGAS